MVTAGEFCNRTVYTIGRCFASVVPGPDGSGGRELIVMRAAVRGD